MKWKHRYSTQLTDYYILAMLLFELFSFTNKRWWIKFRFPSTLTEHTFLLDWNNCFRHRQLNLFDGQLATTTLQFSPVNCLHRTWLTNLNANTNSLRRSLFEKSFYWLNEISDQNQFIQYLTLLYQIYLWFKYSSEYIYELYHEYILLSLRMNIYKKYE